MKSFFTHLLGNTMIVLIFATMFYFAVELIDYLNLTTTESIIVVVAGLLIGATTGYLRDKKSKKAEQEMMDKL